MTALFYRIRRVKGGPLMGAKVWYGVPDDPVTGEPLDRSPRWQVMVGGEFVEPASVIIEFDPAGQPVIKGEVCDRSEYDYLVAAHRWAVDNDPMAPEAAPRSKIDFNKMPAIKF